MGQSKGQWLLLFAFSFTLVLSFQNCSEKNSPDNGNSDPSATTGQETSGEEDDNSAFSFSLVDGDSVSYISDSLNSISTQKKSYQLSFGLGWVNKTVESHWSVTDAETLVPLPDSYCQNSILAHCRDVSSTPCVGAHCLKNSPVQCSNNKKLIQADANIILGLFSSLVAQERVIDPDDVSISDCNTPVVSFYQLDKSPTSISLAKKECVPESQLYATSDTSSIVSHMDEQWDELEKAGDNCNRLSHFNWKSTSFSYSANSGFTPVEFSFLYSVEYADQKAQLRFRLPGSSETLCAENVPVTEIDSFFPTGGLSYSMVRTQFILVDAPTTSIVYKDPVYGDKGEARFFLDTTTAHSNGGGAVIEESQSADMRTAVASMIQRAQDFKLTEVCKN